MKIKNVKMKRIIVVSFILLLSFALTKTVDAMEKHVFNNSSANYFASGMTKEEVDKNCEALFGDPTDDGTGPGKKHGSLAYYLQKGLDIVKYIGIILCVVLTIVDFFKALFSNDKDMLKPLSKKAFSRLIYTVVLFFLPIIIKVLFSVVGLYGTCGIE